MSADSHEEHDRYRFETVIPVLDRLSDNGSRPALIAYGPDGEETVSRRDLKASAQARARALSNAGLERRGRGAVCGPPGADWIEAALGVMSAGATVIPLDAQMSDRHLEHALEDSRPACLIGGDELTDRIERFHLTKAPNVWSWRELAEAAEAQNSGSAFKSPSAEPGDEAVLFYTSGTTGPPKGVPLTHANLAFQINTIRDSKLASPEERLLLALPFHHVYPFVLGLLAPLAEAAPIILPAALTGPSLLEAVREGGATVLIGVPRLYRALLDGIRSRFAGRGRAAAWLFDAAIAWSGILRRQTGWRAGRLLLKPVHRQIGASLRVLASGGSALDSALGRTLEAAGWQVVIGYGLTETAPLLTLRTSDAEPLDSVGTAAPGVELRIDRERVEKPSGGDRREGEILARGPGVFGGYLNLPEETEQVFTEDGWFRTGDLGYLDDGGPLYITGRVSTVMVTESGENIQPDEVEAAYAEHPVIREIGVFETGGALKALAVTDMEAVRDAGETDPREAVQHAITERSQELPSYMGLSDVRVTFQSLPRTRLGKIRRHRLEEQFNDVETGGRERSGGPPASYADLSDDDRALLENETARRVWEWLGERFPDAGLHPDTHLQMQLDIDSMEWINLTLEIRERSGVEIGEAVIARVHTVRDLLRECAEAESAGEETAADPAASPYEVLSEDEQRWLEPLGPVMHALSQGAYWIFSAALRMLLRIRVEGMERLPNDAACVIAPNHTSYLDPFVLGHVLGPGSMSRTYWAGATTAAFDSAAKRFGCRLGRGVPIEPQFGALRGMAFAAAVLNRGHRLVWFPEGRRSRDGNLQAFKPGLGKILDRIPTPVVPVRMIGTYEAWPIHRRRPRPGRVTVRFGEPVDPETLKSEGEGDSAERKIMDGLRRRMESLGSA